MLERRIRTTTAGPSGPAAEAALSNQVPNAREHLARGHLSPLAAGMFGFIGGVLVWHFVGFWAFVTAVVSGERGANNALLTRLVLGQAEHRGTKRIRIAKGEQQPVEEACVTLTLSPNGKVVLQRPCPTGAASLVPRRVAQRGDRQPMHIGGWSTAVAADRAEVDAIVPKTATDTETGKWAAPVITGAVR